MNINKKMTSAAPSNNSDLSTLKNWNTVAAIVHAVAAIVVINVLKNDSTSADKRKVQMTRLAFDPTAPPNQSRVDVPVKLEDDTKVDLKPLIVSFLIITSVFHGLYATDVFGTKLYSNAVLGFGWNPFRWIEYSLSAGVMIYLISAVSGTKDNISAFAAALITPGLMINGLTAERALHQNELANWSRGLQDFKPPVDNTIILSNFIPAWFLFFVKWYIILGNYSKLVKQAKEQNKPIDPSVTFMVFSQLGFFSLFGIIQSYQVFRFYRAKKGFFEPYFISYEKAYIVLSATAKFALAATVAYALRN